MARKLKLSMMIGDYEIVRALKDGTVKPKGIELVVADYPGTRAIHDKVAEGDACDINEFNGGAYVVQKHRGRHDFTAIPVFLHRRFRLGFVYLNKAKGIAKPTDLIGRRVACRTFGPAANYWMRGHLEEDHAVPHRAVTWVIESEDDASRQAPAGLRIERAPRGRNVEEMLLAGEVDAMIAPNVTRMIGEGDPRVARLFPNYRELEAEYYRRTGFFPIMHVTTVPAEIVARHPWVVESLVLAFDEAKQLAYRRLADPRNVPLAWYRTYWEEERALLGSDPWEFGLSDLNKRNYGTLVRWVHAQVLTGPRPKLEDLFPREAFQLELPLPRIHEINYKF
jgi:4,5-dihydroxyphthalate decarboxylase